MADISAQPVIRQRDAKSLGLTRYFTGKHCIHGHLAEKFTSSGYCVECGNIRTVRWNTANPSRRKEIANKYASKNREQSKIRTRLYRGLPTPTRDEPRLCECCGGLPDGKGTMHLDHCHETGKFRGWLCSSCNMAIGKLGDNVEGVMRAINYLKWSTCNG